MTFSLSSHDKLVPEDLRTAFADLVQQEIDTRDPAQGAKLLYEEEPRQLEFHFSFAKQSIS